MTHRDLVFGMGEVRAERGYAGLEDPEKKSENSRDSLKL